MNPLEKEFAPYQESLELKELGFDEPCIMQWTHAPELIFCTSAWGRPKFKTNKESYSDSGGDCISAPTFSQAFMFFRKKYGLHHIIHCPAKNVANFTITGFNIPSVYSNVELKSYEEAELACLRKLIEIVKNYG